MAKTNKNDSNRQNIQHYQKALKEQILAGESIYTEGKEKEELILDKEEKEHPEIEFQSIYKKDDPNRKQFFYARNYFLSKHGKRGHLVRVETTEKEDKIYWVKEDTNGRRRPQYHIPYDKDKKGKQLFHGISTYDLMAIVYGEINAFGLAEDLLESGIFDALGTTKENVEGHHIEEWDPEKADDPNGIQFITEALHYYLNHPVQPDASDKELIESADRFEKDVRREVSEDDAVILEMPFNEETGEIEANKGRYIKLKPEGNNIGAVFNDENGNLSICFDVRSDFLITPNFDAILNNLEIGKSILVRYTFSDTEETIPLIVFKF